MLFKCFSTHSAYSWSLIINFIAHDSYPLILVSLVCTLNWSMPKWAYKTWTFPWHFPLAKVIYAVFTIIYYWQISMVSSLLNFGRPIIILNNAHVKLRFGREKREREKNYVPPLYHEPAHLQHCGQLITVICFIVWIATTTPPHTVDEMTTVV